MPSKIPASSTLPCKDWTSPPPAPPWISSAVWAIFPFPWLCGAPITGIEHNRRSLHWAGRNAVDAGLTTCQFLSGDVEAQLRQLVKRRARFDCILLDPPRQGMGKAMSLLPVLQPRQIVSISCDPATQARDLSAPGRGLSAAPHHPGGHVPADPSRIESVALLERN